MVAMTAIVCAFHLLAAQYIPAQRSKGDIIRFLRDGSKRRTSPDLENSNPLTFAQDSARQAPHTITGLEKPALNEQPEIIHKQTAVFHWSGLSYEVKTKDGTKKILNNVDGWVEPGTLTALMVR